MDDPQLQGPFARPTLTPEQRWWIDRLFALERARIEAAEFDNVWGLDAIAAARARVARRVARLRQALERAFPGWSAPPDLP